MWGFDPSLGQALSGSLGDSPHFPDPTPAQNTKSKTPSRLGSVFPPLFLPCVTLRCSGEDE